MRVPPIIGENWKVWAEDLRKHLGKAQSQLAAREDGLSAGEDGIMIWDRSAQRPVVSVGGAFVDISTDRAYGSVNDGNAITMGVPVLIIDLGGA